MFHLHKEEFQALKSVIWPPDYVTTSMVAEVGFLRICALWYAGIEQGGSHS